MTELLAFLTITLLAVISPGADFAMVSRNSLLYSRRAGLLTALGIGAGVTVHVGYSILGVGVLVRESLALFSALKLAGAAYLVFLGLRMLLAREDSVAEEAAGGAGVSSWAMLRSGFLTNALNPKTCLFVVSLFMQVIDPHTALPAQLGWGLHRARPRGLVRPGRLLSLEPGGARPAPAFPPAHRPVLRRPAGRFRRPAGGEKPVSMDH